MRINWPAAVLALGLSAPAGACPGLEVEEPWIREAPPGAMMTAAYARLRNAGDRLLRIDGGFAANFASAELHRSIVENGISRMVHGEPLELLPGATGALAPGSWHLMLLRPSRPLKAGEQVAVALKCGRQAKEFVFTVKAAQE
jgi:periplasmic copper chaperone A